MQLFKAIISLVKHSIIKLMFYAIFSNTSRHATLNQGKTKEEAMQYKTLFSLWRVYLT